MRPRLLHALGSALVAALASGCDAGAPAAGRADAIESSRASQVAPARATARSVDVDLPKRADRPFRLADRASGAAIEVSLEGAAPAEREKADDRVVYRGAFHGADVIHRVGIEGTEDAIAFAVRPDREEVRYAIEVTNIAGLRLVSRVLELVDASGAPRLRMAAPYVVDRSGNAHDASVIVEGCAFDANPAPPWGRAVTSPGAARCAVRIAWTNAGVTYPAVLDPLWSSTGSLTTARNLYAASVLGTGKVLAVGGLNGALQTLATSELYDPGTGTWAATGSMKAGRYYHTLTLLGTGRALVAGGESLGSAELYDPATGKWTSTGSMSVARSNHTASLLGNGKVLAAGGDSASTTELYDPTSGTWAATGSLSGLRYSHTASVLPGGDVLVAGGFGSGTTLATAERYSAATGSWTMTGSMVDSRADHAAGVVGGKVVVTGGYSSSIGGAGAGALASAEAYDPATGKWSSAGSIGQPRYDHSASVLPNGDLLVAGGYYSALNAYYDVVNVYDPATGAWSSGGTLVEPHAFQTASVLANGKVLIAGGQNAAGYLASADLFTQYANGSLCPDGFGDCASGHCADGVCCDQACGACLACTAAKKGSGVDGVCGPLPAGTDPDNDCADLGAATCLTNGVCDGAGKCQLYASGTICVFETCSNGTLSGSTCDGLGTCKPSFTSCGAYACASATACATSCTTDASCATNAWCDAPVCRVKAANGQPCSTGTECASSECVDGVCCNVACTGQCEACDSATAGTCTPVVGAPHGTRAPCAPGSSGDPCSASACDGQNIASCTYVSATVACRAASCTSGVETLAASCNGQGACPQPVTKTCEPYVCKGDACGTKPCATDADCAPKFRCDKVQMDCVPASAATCDGAHTLSNPDGTTTDCTPYACDASGTCKTTCMSTIDCAAPNQCDEQGHCSPPAAAASGASGCGCRIVEPSSGAADAAFALCALAIAAARRRRSADTQGRRYKR